MLEVRVADGGAWAPPRSFLSLRLDADWDGEAETKLDSVAVEVPAGGEAVLRLGMGAGVRGIVRAALVAPEDGWGGAGEDEDPGNDVALLPVEPGRPLAFTEWHAAPEPGEAEWVEIRNRTADSGGVGRKLDLGRAAFNGLGLGARVGANPGGLEPGEFLVLTGSLEKFTARYGSLKARILQIPGWKPLRNSGDTLVLTLAGFTVDSVTYGGGRTGAPGTPGYAAAAVAADGWSLSGKLVEAGRPLDVEVSVRSAFVLRLFDLEGDVVRELGRGGPGRSRIGWDGTGEGGRRLQPGPYILGLSIEGKRTRREVVLLRSAP
jgi:hypothetical protein